MKRILLSILMVAACLCGAMAQNDAMFVYRNDGQINAFLKADVDSMRYSHIGLDSLYHGEYVVQEVWTPDSIYRIPLAAIDSVSFVTPPTVYKTDVTRLDGTLLDYVVGCDSLTLKLKTDTPVGIVPKAGDKLVLLDGCEVLPYGFSGIVSEVRTESDGIDVVCEQAYLEDLFDSFCNVSTMYGSEDTDTRYVVSSGRPNRVVYNPDDKTLKLIPINIDATSEISSGITPESDLALKGGLTASISIKPTLRVHTFLILGEGHGTYFNCSVTGVMDVESKLSLYGGIEYSHDFERKKSKYECIIPATGGLVRYYIVPGAFGRIGATVSFSLSDNRSYTFGMNYEYSSIGENVLKPSLGHPRLVSSSTNFEGGIDGSAAVGAFVETGFNLLSRDLLKVYVRGELGFQLNGGFVLRNSEIDEAAKNTKLYEQIRASSIETGPFVNLSMGGSVLNEGPSVSIGGSATLKEWDLVPTFSNTTIKHSTGSSSSADVSTEMSGDCLFPVTVGFKLFDSNGNEAADFNSSNKYTNQDGSLSHCFIGIDRDKSYTVYPKVKLFGFDILASPSAELVTAHPEITGFKVTGSAYSPGGFLNDGIAYDYKFDVALTAEIDNLDGVADWGYVYKDPYGNIKRISLMQYGTSYTDTRYSYYRNYAKSTACLYTYVWYDGDSEYYYSEPHDYPLEYAFHSCPDDNHPHAIDLGLPSGTKWCCRNVGASSPEDYGGYYAWGETSEKSEYSWTNYAYYNSSTRELSDIGAEISGTQYDVAHVVMGGSWRMPTLEQIKELSYYCTWKWTQLNGVNGQLVTGPNGGQIFLPAAGYRWDGDLDGAGSDGHYWSGSLGPVGHYGASVLFFGSGTGAGTGAGTGSGDRYHRRYGLSVRAVCP